MNKEKPTLKALLTAVDNYPNPKHKLKGCVNDLEDFTEFLETWHDPDKVVLDIVVLKDEDATRTNIVKAFSSHFCGMKPGDIAFFYFSGHGYSGTAPEEYWHFTPNKKYETLVCYDSRTPGGRDLADKELSYLIFEVMKQRGVRFTAILDCCHSGSALRGMLDDKDGIYERDEWDDSGEYGINEFTQVREIKSVGKQNVKISFLGQEDHVHHNGNTTVPYGRHVLLSSCRDYEKAREITFDGKRRGVFTYCLLQALRKSNGILTYSQLMAKTKAEVSYHNLHQHPQMVLTHVEDADGSFLEGSIIEKPVWILVHRHPTQGWKVDIGMIHGLTDYNVNCNGAHLRLFDEATPDNQLNTRERSIGTATITGIYSNYSTLRLNEKMDVGKQYKATFLQLPTSKLKVGLILDDLEPSTAVIKSGIDEVELLYSVIIKNIDKTSHLIKFQAGHLFFCQKEQERKLFTTRMDDIERAIPVLLEYIETYARWNSIKRISNPPNTFNPADIQLEFTVVTKATPDYLDVIEEVVIDNFLTKDIVLPYQKRERVLEVNNLWEEPMFRLKIKNTSSKKRFWCSLLFLGSDFSISNELMPSTDLGPGEECWAEFDDPDDRYKTTLIRLNIEDEYLKNGIYKIIERFKIIVSTEQLDTSVYNQEGIPLDVMNMDNWRGLYRASRSMSGDFVQWAVFDFAIKVVLPKDKTG